MELYLDYAATTPLDPRVLEAMLPFFREVYGNPSSLHRPGQAARKAVATARDQVAVALGARPKEIIFTSGATEADNQAIRGAAAQRPGGHLVTSRVEHAAVLSTCRVLETQGYDVTYLAPNERGEVSVGQVAEVLRDDTLLVALMAVNNETGVRTDVAAVGDLLRGTDTLFFCDAVQAFGFEEVNVDEWGVDLLSVSGHKVYGPKGVGALYVREGLDLSPILYGGEQERGLRAGTHPVPDIVGLGRAAELAGGRLNEARALRTLRDGFERKLLSVNGVSVNGAGAPRGPKHSNAFVRGVDGEALLMNLDALGLFVSAGSACAAGSIEPSHVLTAMGLSREAAKASVRFSLGYGLSEGVLTKAAAHFAEAVARCRAFAEA